MNFGPFPPMAGCQRYIGIFTDGIKVHSRNSSPMSSKEKKNESYRFATISPRGFSVPAAAPDGRPSAKGLDLGQYL